MNSAFSFMILLFLAPLLSASGDEPRILSKDDAEFARRLGKAGFPDLADEVLRALIGSKAAGSDEAAQTELLRSDLLNELSQRETDPERRRSMLLEVVAAREAFVEAQKGTPAADEVGARLPELYLSVGEVISSLAQKESDPDKAKAQKEEVANLFRRSEKLLNTRLNDLNVVRTENRDDEAANNQYMLTAYNLVRTSYFHAILLDPGAPSRSILLDRVTELMGDFELEFSDQLLCYDALIYSGLARKAAGDFEGALRYLDASIAVRETYGTTPGGVYDIAADVADIVSSAALQKLLILLEEGPAKSVPAAIDLAKDFLSTTPSPYSSGRGLAVLAKLAEAYDVSGDRSLAEETARRLIEVDPRGPGGARGRELLDQLGGGGGGLGIVDLYQMANTQARQGQVDAAADACRRVIDLARLEPANAKAGADACYLLGSLFSGRKQYQEAAVAWDLSVELFPEAEKTPDALWSSVNAYIVLSGQERKGFYKKRVQERMSQLASLYPKHPHAASAQLIEGRQLVEEQEYLKAAEMFEKVAPGSTNYEEALFRCGDAYSAQARKLINEGKKSAGLPFATKAEEILKRARTELEAAAGRTLDSAMVEKLKGYAFASRVGLANLYLMKGVDKPQMVGPLFENAEQEFAGDPNKIATVWTLQFKSLQDQGKLDDALKLVDEELRKNPQSKGVAAIAGNLATELDKRAGELRATRGDAAADEMLRKAVRFYALGMQAQVSGQEAVRVSEVEGVAGRLLALGLHFNGVPKEVSSFTEWTESARDTECWEQAAALYESVLPWSPSTKTLISLGRSYGFLRRWKDAARIYDQIFEQEQPFIDPATKRIRADALRAKPELLSAYLERGLSEYQWALEENDTDRLGRATSIFESLTLSAQQDSKPWWQSKYLQLKSLADRGKYDIADIALRSVERNSDGFDGGKYGYRERFETLKKEIDRKLLK